MGEEQEYFGRRGICRRELLEWLPPLESGRQAVATPNYGYEKRQKELAKKRKKEEKLKEKAQRKQGGPAGDAAAPADDVESQPETPASGEAAQP